MGMAKKTDILSLCSPPFRWWQKPAWNSNGVNAKKSAQARAFVVRMDLVAQSFVCAMDDVNPCDIIF